MGWTPARASPSYRRAPGEHSLVLAHGPVQCGKTHAACTAFFGWVALHWEGQDIGLIGSDVGPARGAGDAVRAGGR